MKKIKNESFLDGLTNVIQFPCKRPKLEQFDHVTAIGYIGLILLQAQYIPAIWECITTGSSAPVSSILLFIIGLACYLYNSVKLGNTLYTIGNAIGIIGNLILLGMVITK